MLALHPFNNWPLRVKLFTENAIKGWQGSCKDLDAKFPLPLGFQFTTELEGVDGKSGNFGSGRKGKLDVTDSACLTKLHLPTAYILSQTGLPYRI